MSTKPDIKKLLKYGAPALLDLANPTRSGELRRQQRSLFGRRKKWQLCYVILARECLYVFENKDSTEAQFASPVSRFECAKANGTAEIDGEDVCFIIRFEDVHKKTLIFACDVDKTRRKWIKSINEVISDVKKCSTDSAYLSGGSLYSNGSLRNSSSENESKYQEIDESMVTTNIVDCKQTTIGQRHCTMTRQPTSIQPVSDDQDSGFVHVGIHSSSTPKVKTPYIQQKEVGNDDTLNMQYLKPPVTESSTGSDNPYQLNSGGNSQTIYENTEDASATYSNVNIYPLSEHITQNTRQSSPKYGAAGQKTKPKVASKSIMRRQIDTQRPNMAARLSPTQPASVQPDSGHLIVGEGFSSSTEVKTLYRSRGGIQLDDPSENYHRIQNLKLDTTVESSNSDSGEESPIYENTNFGKVFEKEDYFCWRMNIKNLKSKPIGTFFVRPGKETIYELAIRTDFEDGVSLFRIYEKNGLFYFIEGVEFSSLEKLVGHYSYTEIPSKKFKATLKQGYNKCS